MKKLLLSFLLSTGLFANYTSVDCTEMSKVIGLLQGYTKTCFVEPNLHMFKQELAKDTSGTIEYESGESIPFTTTDKVIGTNIEADKPFRFRIGDYTSVKFKLTILSTGEESWKYFYEGTNRWRKYTFDVINFEDIVQEVLPNETPNDPLVEVLGRILKEDQTPFPDITVEITTAENTYSSVTNNKGEFTAFVPLNTAFKVRAYNILSQPNDWSEYVHFLKIDNTLQTLEQTDGVWNIDTKDKFDIVKIIAGFELDEGTTEFKQLDEYSVSFTPKDASVTKQGVRMVIPASLGQEVSIGFNVSHRTNLWISNRAPVKMLEPNKILEAGNYTTTVTAEGDISVYFAPKEQETYLINNISIK